MFVVSGEDAEVGVSLLLWATVEAPGHEELLLPIALGQSRHLGFPELGIV